MTDSCADDDTKFDISFNFLGLLDDLTLNNEHSPWARDTDTVGWLKQAQSEITEALNALNCGGPMWKNHDAIVSELGDVLHCALGAALRFGGKECVGQALDSAVAKLHRRKPWLFSGAAMPATVEEELAMLVTPDGYGFVYIPGPRFCACGRVESDCDQSRASCPKADPASEGDDETDIIIAGRQVPFVQVGMIVHPDDCLNCERDGSPLWCSALVCDIHDDDETARFGMMATLLFRNGERREEPCDELRRRWRLARDFDQGRVYTGRWGAIPRGSVWPVAEVNEDA